MPTNRSRRRDPRLLLIAPALALLLGAGACSAAETSGSPDAPSEGSSAAAPEAAAYDTANHEWELKLAQCFRDEGIDVEDPKPGGYIGDGDGDPAWAEAYPTCSKKIGDPPVREYSPAEDQANLEEHLVLVKCLRGKGYEMKDPILGEPLVMPEDSSNGDVGACTEEAEQ